MLLTSRERELCKVLRDLPERYSYRYTKQASQAVQQALFRSLFAGDERYLRALFRGRLPQQDKEWCLREAQGIKEGAEYTEAARGKPCGHIFKFGEATYRCRTCTLDDTCVLCSRCFDASDHTDHLVNVSISPGNSGCCDCGDQEAWRIPVHCSIHDAEMSSTAGKMKQIPSVHDEFLESIRMTIGRAVDYMCDVISCSPEQLRLQKTEDTIRQDERLSHLASKWYEEAEDPDPEFALVLWNDEKHTVDEVQTQVARACKERMRFGLERANETNDIGRSVVKYSKDIPELLKCAKVIEDIKVTVTIRSSRDTFREQMCGTITEWLVDIAGCSVNQNDSLFRQVICEELLKVWRTGSAATNSTIGKDMDDHEVDESAEVSRDVFMQASRRDALAARQRVIETTLTDRNAARMAIESALAERNDLANEEEDNDEAEGPVSENEMELDMEFLNAVVEDSDRDIEMRTPIEPEDETEVSEATYAGYPPPPPPPPPPARPSGPRDVRMRGHSAVMSEYDSLEPMNTTSDISKANIDIPRTPYQARKRVQPRPPSYWLEQPEGYASRESIPLHEDLRQRVRLDWMILFDLRMWKKARVDLRDLYISTVVNIPQFKRILGLRFAGLYTVLAQLYLVADREPDHSIINLSLQMLTTPSITEEIVERGNFLTNLMSILYTFLTTRQVGHPWEMSSTATLAFDAGSVANRRMAHFFQDLHYLLGCGYVQAKLRTEERYVLQLLDLVKLPQGICPNIRAVGDHVEYETDAWISASLLTKEINKLCRQFAESFRFVKDDDLANLSRVIRTVAKATVVNCAGAERVRFDQAELKTETRFKDLEPFRFDSHHIGYDWNYSVVDFVVEREPISFHHALHYTLSWLIDCGKSMPLEQIRSLLQFSSQDIQESSPSRSLVSERDPESYLMALFDLPLRVCVWLAQMKAGIWVRNGLSLRHQMHTYRGVLSRDLAHHRDIFLLQIAMVVCDPSRVLASMIERFGMDDWMRGTYNIRPGYEPYQQLDVAEDFIHLLIVLLSDRTSLLPKSDHKSTQALAIRRDISHILCFKPLSFSALSERLSEKFTNQEEFQELLEGMTNFRAPEGLSDTGTFELKPEHLADIDPYIAHYSKNQRDEAENVYRTWKAKQNGQPVVDVVFEPRLPPILKGIFQNLSSFTSTPLFVQILYYALWARKDTGAFQGIPNTRFEAFVQVVLHLMLAAVIEDQTCEGDAESRPSFTLFALKGVVPGTYSPSLFGLLVDILDAEDIKGCHPKINLIIHHLRQRRPQLFRVVVKDLEDSKDGEAHILLLKRLGTETTQTPSSEDGDAKQREIREAKKRQALERQAKVMAQFQQQQQNFMKNQESIDWGDDELDDAESVATGATEEHRRLWKYPTGNCILCQEETNDARIYGTFGMITNSRILRQTDFQNLDIVEEVLFTPLSLDRSAEELRPFGLAGYNRIETSKITSDGRKIVSESRGLSHGYPPSHAISGPVSSGCGHIMHFNCFELYCTSAERRQGHQIARNHPERLKKKEFVCPLCKALGNVFLPIIWRGKEEVYPGALEVEVPFDDWLDASVGLTVSRFQKRGDGEEALSDNTRYRELFATYASKAIIPPLASRLSSHALTSPVLPAPMSPLRSLMPSLFLADEGHNAMSPWPNSPNTLLEELTTIYARLKVTIRANSLPTMFPEGHGNLPDVADISSIDTLPRTLGFSIAAIEIAQRGVPSDPGMTLLDKIPALTLTHLRMLSETASSYIAIGGLKNLPLNPAAEEFRKVSSRQLRQLFVGHPQMTSDAPEVWGRTDLLPALAQDPAVLLAECSVCLVPAFGLDIHHVLRLCYLLELVKVVFFLTMMPDALYRVSNFWYGGRPWRANQIPEAIGLVSTECVNALRGFCVRIQDFACPDHRGDASIERTLSEIDERIYTLITPYALAFLRKAVILLHVRHGVNFPDTGFADMDKPEIERLTKALRLPTLPEMLDSVGSNVAAGLTVTQSIVSGWIAHSKWNARASPTLFFPSLRPSHPAIFELIGLPKNFDTLTHEAMSRRCPTTGKDIVDPALCLFCGALFCSQAICCHKDGKGGCSQHMTK